MVAVWVSCVYAAQMHRFGSLDSLYHRFGTLPGSAMMDSLKTNSGYL